MSAKVTFTDTTQLSARLARVQLNVDTIVTAALGILNKYGLADMTMRRVASTLGVAPGALYWHIKNKQELITAIAERILATAEEARTLDDAQLDPAVESSHPGIDVARRCAALRTGLLAHRDGAEVVMAAMTQPGSTIRERIVEELTAELAGLGLDRGTAGEGANALLHQVFGSTSLEQSARQNLELLQAEEAPASQKVTPDTGVALLLDALTRRV